MRCVLKALVVWSVILVFAVLNGALREAILMPTLGTTAAQVISGVLLSIIIFIAAYLFLPWLGMRSPKALFGVGFIWLVCTVIFEFSFGLWLGKTWQSMLDAYAFKDGNMWPLVLVVTLFAPYLVGKLKAKR